MTTKAKAPTREELAKQLRSTRDLTERRKIQNILDGDRSPLLTTLQALEEQHGRKELEKAIDQWDQHEKDGPLAAGGTEPDTPRMSKDERALAPPNVPVNSLAYVRWADEHPDHPAAKLAVREKEE